MQYSRSQFTVAWPQLYRSLATVYCSKGEQCEHNRNLKCFRSRTTEGAATPCTGIQERIQSVYCSIVGCQAQTTAQDEGDSGQKDAHAEPRLHSASHKTMR